MTEIMKGITCCADCAYYNTKKHRCTRATDEGKPTDHFYADCPLPTVTNAQGWISVKDRLPDESGDYLVLSDKGNAHVWSYSVRHKAFNAFDLFEDAHYALPVTYWMPLPELPKEERE